MSEKETDIAILNTMVIKNNREGKGLVAESLDGKLLSPTQQAALKRFEAAAFPPKEPESVQSAEPVPPTK